LFNSRLEGLAFIFVFPIDVVVKTCELKLKVLISMALLKEFENGHSTNKLMAQQLEFLQVSESLKRTDPLLMDIMVVKRERYPEMS
jgi:hypothetical protein